MSLDNEELVLKLRAVAVGLQETAKQAQNALNSLGKSYVDMDKSSKEASAATDELSEAQKRQEEETIKQRQAQEQANKELVALSAVTAIATKAVMSITSAVTSGIDAYNQYTSAINGLRSVATGTGESLETLDGIMNELTADGLMSRAEASASIKNLKLYGYTAQQTLDILRRLKDSAAYNREAHYSFGQAVQKTTEGIRMENSILSDAAGVTKNIAMMYREYASEMGITVDAMTQAQKAQAVYNGVMDETEIIVGNAAKYAQEFAGKQAELAASTLETRRAFGEAVTMGLGPFYELLTGGSKALTKFIDDNKALVAILTTVITTITALIALMGAKAAAIKLLGFLSLGAAKDVTTLSGALLGLKATLSGPFVGAAIGIAAVVGIIAGIAAHAENARRKAEELRQELENMRQMNTTAAKLVDEYEQLEGKINKSADETQRMVDIRAELVEKYKLTVAAVDEEGRLLAGNTAEMREQLKVQELLWLEKKKQNIESEKHALWLYSENDKAVKSLQRSVTSPEGINSTNDALTHHNRTLLADYQKRLENELQNLEKSGSTAKRVLYDLVTELTLEAEQGGKRIPEALIGAIQKEFQNNTENWAVYDKAKSYAQQMIDAYTQIDEQAVADAVHYVKGIRDELIAGFAMDENLSNDKIGKAAKAVDDVLSMIAGTEGQQKAYERGMELRNKLVEGIALTPEEKAEFNAISIDILDDLLHIPDEYLDLAPSIRDLASQFSKSAEELSNAANVAKAAGMTFADTTDDLKSAYSTVKSMDAALSEVGNLKGAAQAIEEYNQAAVKTAELTSRNEAAKKYLANAFGMEADAINDGLDAIQDEIKIKEALALAEYAVGLQAVLTSQQIITAKYAEAEATDEAARRMIETMDTLVEKYIEMGTAFNANTLGGSIVASTRGKWLSSGNSSKSGSSAYKNEALDREIALLNHRRALDQLTTQEIINNLERIKAKYAKTTDEKRQLTEELYSLRRQKAQEDLDYQISMDQLTLREQMKAIDAMIAQQKQGTQARRDLELERYHLQRELERQEYDLKVHYGQLTLAQQEQEIKKMIAAYKAGTQARIELEKELYSVQQSLRQQNIDTVNKLAAGAIEALRARYEEHRKIEQDRLIQSIEDWGFWGQAQVKAIQDQIKALDDLTKKEDRDEEERRRRREIAALEQAAQYEKDQYNQQKLREQIAQQQADLEKWLKANERTDLKEALQAQINLVNETVQVEQDALRKQLEAVNDRYDSITEQAKLEAEAQQLIMKGSQAEILKLLQDYAPDYNLTGKTLGEKLVDGFISKVKDIDVWFNQFTSKFTSFQEQLASVATTAANQYYQGWATSGGQGTSTVKETIINLYFQGNVESPAQIRRELERLAADLANI